MLNKEKLASGMLVLFLLSVVGVQAKPPVTQGRVSRPKTADQPSGPSLQTTATVNRPVTQVTVLKPVTTATVNQLQTTVTVPHPQTNVFVNHPSTPLAEQPDAVSGASFSVSKKGESSSKKLVNTIPSSSSPTSMSNFQMPKAKDLKAANLTKGEEGLGNPNDAEKSAAAASFQVPTGKEASAENLKSIMEKAGSVNKGSLEKKLESQTK